MARQASRINGEVVETPLKTKNSYRTISLGGDAVGILKERKKTCGVSEYAFPSPIGGPISPDSVIQMLHQVLKRAGLPKVRFHDLRQQRPMFGVDTHKNQVTNFFPR